MGSSLFAFQSETNGENDSQKFRSELGKLFVTNLGGKLSVLRPVGKLCGEILLAFGELRAHSVSSLRKSEYHFQLMQPIAICQFVINCTLIFVNHSRFLHGMELHNLEFGLSHCDEPFDQEAAESERVRCKLGAYRLMRKWSGVGEKFSRFP
jgi:hypothetical protein